MLDPVPISLEIYLCMTTSLTDINLLPSNHFVSNSGKNRAILSTCICFLEFLQFSHCTLYLLIWK